MLQFPKTDDQIIEDSRFEIESGQVSLFDALAYILGGDACFTTLSIKTGKRFTFKCEQSKKWDNTLNKEVPQDRWFISVLSGPDNNSNYSYIGTIDTKENNKWILRLTAKSKVSTEAESFKAITTILDYLQNSVKFIDGLRDKLKVFHDGNCSKCGRHLTDPVSISTSFGPICAPLSHKSFKQGCKKRGIIIDKKNNKLIYPEGYQTR
jgi:hypothetical protein